MGESTGPSGYRSNTRAIYHLIRHGPHVIKPASRFLVLLFHAERSTGYGKPSDQHSQAQAIEGVYSHKAERRTGGYGAWVRGTAGVSLAQYKRANRALVKAGLLQAERRFRPDRNHAADATEYLPNWLAIRAALEAHELDRPAPKPKPLFTPVQEAPPGSPRATPLAHHEPHSV
jgi:hypothetical protein